MSVYMCSVHVFCLVTGSEEELNPVLMALKRSADRKMPSKSLEDISSATPSEHKACLLSSMPLSLKVLVLFLHPSSITCAFISQQWDLAGKLFSE